MSYRVRDALTRYVFMPVFTLIWLLTHQRQWLLRPSLQSNMTKSEIFIDSFLEKKKRNNLAGKRYRSTGRLQWSSLSLSRPLIKKSLAYPYFPYPLFLKSIQDFTFSQKNSWLAVALARKLALAKFVDEILTPVTRGTIVFSMGDWMDWRWTPRLDGGPAADDGRSRS